ncbi:Type II secretion system F domain [Desulfurobacterium thermolithotrophum DSM 11699]|uniref:Type II secretion system F domain n=1 Tax=Desulfurobacterium thermolithotrophum (strain DSM 11699 / BSA) TaxID=868864 RepID=F0S2G7_DESTD|nr:type II secretion system F family protein [Desulfurobacterium thermolithotrophum]ADY73039.1 Type II secretion system F domain [Desulfurobacterium thermolithotrophum DSM 11699]
MGVFTYKGYDKEGKERKGVIEASSRSGAISILKSQGIFPYEIKEEAIKKRNFSFSIFKKALSVQELAVFFRTLATLLDAGIPLIEAIESLSENFKEDRKKIFMTKIVNNLREGKSLSESLKIAGIKDPVIVSFVSSGEKGGTLVQSLEIIASILEKREELKSTIINALIYPVVLLVVAIGVVVFMMLSVIPKIVSIYTSMKISLPLSTKITLFISNGFINYYHFILIFFVFLTLFFIFLEKRKKREFDKFKLRLPVFGKLFLYIELNRFFETLSSLLKAGIPIVDAMISATHTVKNEYLKERLLLINNELKKGKSLATLFSKEIKELPTVALQLIKAGEQSGRLAELLSKVSKFLRNEVEIYTKNLTSMLEPAIMIIIGLIVGFIVFSLLLPIVEISTIKKV